MEYDRGQGSRKDEQTALVGVQRYGRERSAKQVKTLAKQENENFQRVKIQQFKSMLFEDEALNEIVSF